MLRTVQAMRYITPMREGGSMPALVEADDGRQYVVKLRGAGQGTLALVAELLVGEMARRLGLHVPELVLVTVDPLFGRAERDPEIRDLLRASSGVNVGLAFLAGATTFDLAAGDAIDSLTASLIVWLDAFTLNVDRTSRNANLLLQDDAVWLIDHGAALYFHHNWPSAQGKVSAKFEQVAEHILLPWATDLAVVSTQAHARLNADFFASILQAVPDDWLQTEGLPITAVERRAAYLDFFLTRLRHSSIFEKHCEEEVQRVRAGSV